MGTKLYDSELRIMDLLWKRGDQPAKALARQLQEQVGWNKNTTYTVIKKLIEKGAVSRAEPGFICHALVSRQAAQAQEVTELIDRMFDGREDLLFASLLGRAQLPEETIQRLRRMVDEEGGTC